jgi:hypothetical protein
MAPSFTSEKEFYVIGGKVNGKNDKEMTYHL